MRVLFGMMFFSIGLTADAQGFNRRYDPLAQPWEQNGMAIELADSGRYVVLGSTAVQTSGGDYYNPVILTLLLDADGAVLAVDTLIEDLTEFQPGGWGCTSPVSSLVSVSAIDRISMIDNTRRATICVVSAPCTLTILEHFGALGEEWSGSHVIPCKGGGYLLAGGRTVDEGPDAFLIRTDDSGELLWQQVHAWPLREDFLLALDTTADDGFFASGQARPDPGGYRFSAMRFTSSGDTLWTRTWGGSPDQGFLRLSTKGNANPLVAGAWGWSTDYDSTDLYMAELDQFDGSIIWERHYGPVGYGPRLYAVKESAPGQGHIAAGGTVEWDTSQPFFKGLLLRSADNGDSLWMRTYFYYDSVMTDGMGTFFDAVPTPDGGAIACGNAYHANAGADPYPSRDIWVVKVDSLGCIVPGCDIALGITAQITNMGYALDVYPNPAKDQLHVGIKLPAGFKTEGPITLSVVSMDGKVLRQVTVPTSAPNEVVLDVTGLAAGTCTLHLSDAHTWIAGKKFVLCSP